MAALKSERKRRGHLVIAVAEVNRGMYRSRNPADRVDPLAGGKESSSIEYGAHVLLSLSSVAGSADLVDVAMPKNRLGRKEPFRLRQDFRHCTFAEVAIDDPDCRAAPTAGASLMLDVAAITPVVVRSQPIRGTTGIRMAVRAHGIEMGQTRIDAAWARLIMDGAVENRPEGRQPRWFWKGANVPE